MNLRNVRLLKEGASSSPFLLSLILLTRFLNFEMDSISRFLLVNARVSTPEAH